MWDKLFSTVDGLEKGMEVSWLRGQVLSNNIANADTPGFKASDVEFGDILAEKLGDASESGTGGGLALKTTREQHMTGSAGSGGLSSAVEDTDPVTVQNEDQAYRMDQNSVDIESEMVELAQNSLQYYTMVSKVSGEFRRLNMAISGQV